MSTFNARRYGYITGIRHEILKEYTYILSIADGCKLSTFTATVKLTLSDGGNLPHVARWFSDSIKLYPHPYTKILLCIW